MHLSAILLSLIPLCQLALAANSVDDAARVLQSANIGNRIIGGSDAPRNRYSWMVWYVYSGAQCGGSMIAPDLFLTNAHCWKPGAENLGVAYVGKYDTSDRQEGGPVIQVVEAQLHPDYVDEGNYYDLAIMKLERQVENQVTVNLNADEDVPAAAGDELLLLGWGSLTDGVSAPIQLSNILQQAPTKFVPFEQCAVARDPILGIEYGFSTERTGVGPDWLCTFDEEFAHCRGDSGGPVLIPGTRADEDLLVGVISGVAGGCKSLVPQINMKVSFTLPWILDTGCEMSVNPPAEWNCPSTPTKAPVPAPTEAPQPAPTPAPVADPTLPPSRAPFPIPTNEPREATNVPTIDETPSSVAPSSVAPSSVAPIASESSSRSPVPTLSTNETAVPTLDLSEFPPIPENSTKIPIYVKILFDEHPEHISWFISDLGYSRFKVGVPYGAYRPGEVVANDRVMVDGGDDYMFVISDLLGDGLGGESPGSFEVFLGREFEYEVLASGSGDFGENSTFAFSVPCYEGTCAPTLDPTSSPSFSQIPSFSPNPSAIETEEPSLNTTSATEEPSNEPTPSPTSEIGDQPPVGQPPTNSQDPVPTSSVVSHDQHFCAICIFVGALAYAFLLE